LRGFKMFSYPASALGDVLHVRYQNVTRIEIVNNNRSYASTFTTIVNSSETFHETRISFRITLELHAETFGLKTLHA
jgi:hypothetical protein